MTTTNETTKWMSGARWGRYITDGGETVTMFRVRQACRFYTDDGRQVGPEQRNVAPAIAYTMAHGWTDATTAEAR